MPLSLNKLYRFEGGGGNATPSSSASNAKAIVMKYYSICLLYCPRLNYYSCIL